MLTGTTTKEETREIFSRLTQYDPATAGREEKEIKLCYVTVSHFSYSSSRPLSLGLRIAGKNCQEQNIHLDTGETRE